MLAMYIQSVQRACFSTYDVAYRDHTGCPKDKKRCKMDPNQSSPAPTNQSFLILLSVSWVGFLKLDRLSKHVILRFNQLWDLCWYNRKAKPFWCFSSSWRNVSNLASMLPPCPIWRRTRRPLFEGSFQRRDSALETPDVPRECRLICQDWSSSWSCFFHAKDPLKQLTFWCFLLKSFFICGLVEIRWSGAK